MAKKNVTNVQLPETKKEQLVKETATILSGYFLAKLTKLDPAKALELDGIHYYGYAQNKNGELIKKPKSEFQAIEKDGNVLVVESKHILKCKKLSELVGKSHEEGEFDTFVLPKSVLKEYFPRICN